MEKVILIYPETSYESRKITGCLLPLSVLQLAAPLLKQGIQVRIIDQRVTENWRKELREELQQGGIICVGVSSMTGPQIMGGLESSEIVREVSPHTPIVWGGVHPTLEPQKTMEHDLVDIIVIGDGENIFSQLTQALLQKVSLSTVPGIYFKDGSVIKTKDAPLQDIDDLLWPAYELVDMSNYLESPFHSGKAMGMVTSRGCPYKCAYCYTQSFFSRRWKGRSADNVVDHMLLLQKEYHVDSIFLLEDEFFVDRKRVERIVDRFQKENIQLKINNANMTIREVLKYDHELLELMHKIGFQQLFIGVETGSDELLEKIQKDITVDMILQANRKLKKAGITPIYSWMTGFPFETEKHTKQTLSLMNRLLEENPATTIYSLNMFAPYPGTQLFEYCKKEGMIPPNTLQEWSKNDCFDVYHKSIDAKDNDFFTKALLIVPYLDKKIWSHQKGLKGFLKRVYSHILRFRIKRNFYSFMPEIPYFQYKLKKYREKYLNK